MLRSSVKAARRVVAGLVSVVALGAAAQALAEPALWKIQDQDSTIYLFGTVHVLRPETQWRSAKLDSALKLADELVLEVVGADDMAVMQPLIMKYGIDPATPLSKKLAAADWEKTKTYGQEMGVPPAAIEAFRPWMAAITLAMAPMVKAGFDPKKGVEQVLTAELKADGKGVGQLETAEQQIRFFADLPAADEVLLLKSTLDEVEEGPAKLDAMVKAWAAGDVKGLEGQFITEMRAKYKPLYSTLIVTRNTAWADQLKTKLDGKGVSFVAVGAGHLVGPDSVQTLLGKRGIKVERVQ
ncbi:TraB/GumN family protein [Caulobacter endophyticus]|uniref:TraB/GumN family protein n=1 Tax=Caulobacter endophyticus TaxID=2172652 RepID=A0A2T9K652_9CAUL|nr:TraB/GumN family protein [Caulobacter endophyticus]PVM91281.1 TraB/GumN family protein [Caulobacter endophyticus]